MANDIFKAPQIYEPNDMCKEAIQFIIICGKMFIFFFGSRPCQIESILVCLAIHITFRYRSFVEIHQCMCARFLFIHYGLLFRIISVCSIVLCVLCRHYYFLLCDVCALLRRVVFILLLFFFFFNILRFFTHWQWCYFFFVFQSFKRVYTKQKRIRKKIKLHFSLQQKKCSNKQHLSTELCVANRGLYVLRNEHNDNGKQMKKKAREKKNTQKWKRA